MGMLMKLEKSPSAQKMCVCCLAPKATLSCHLCQGFICKDCTEFVDGETFSFQQILTDDLKHTQYCRSCHTLKVLPAVIKYRGIMARAKKAFVIDKPQRRPLPVTKRFETAIHVIDCIDREETMLRLAFQAAELGF